MRTQIAEEILKRLYFIGIQLTLIFNLIKYSNNQNLK